MQISLSCQLTVGLVKGMYPEQIWVPIFLYNKCVRVNSDFHEIIDLSTCLI